MVRPEVQGLGLMGRVLVEVSPIQDLKVIKAGTAIKAIRATRVVIINREISSSNNQVTEVTRSS